MTSLLDSIATLPTRTLEPDEILIVQGEGGGDLFILKSGSLTVERDGVTVATLATAGAPVGEMSVLLGTRNSATVRANGPTTVRVIRDAPAILESDPALTFWIARLVAGRLHATSALLVNLTREHQGQGEQSLLSRIISSLHLPAGGNYVPTTRGDLFGDGEPARS